MNPNSCYLSYSRKTPPKWKDMKLIKLCFFAFVHLCFFDKNRLLFSIFDISSVLLIFVRKCQIGDVRKGLVVKTEIAKNMHKNHCMAKCHFFYYGKRSNGKKISICKCEFLYHLMWHFCAIWTPSSNVHLIMWRITFLLIAIIISGNTVFWSGGFAQLMFMW